MQKKKKKKKEEEEEREGNILYILRTWVIYIGLYKLSRVE
jgi:hypothetical protein